VFRLKEILTILALAFCGFSQAQQTEKLYLSGTGSDKTVNWEFFCTGGMNSNKWTTIPVPSCWETQGFGKYDYGFAKDSVRGKEKGLYKYTFNVPANWKNKKINIVFEGSMTDTEVKINGQLAGEVHQGAFYAFKYGIANLVKYGASNLLEVTVSKHSANESVNVAERRADFWIFGGIFRPVYLEAVPYVNISSISIDAKADGNFTAMCEVNGMGAYCDKATVQLFTSDNKPVGQIQGFDISNSWTHYNFAKKIPSVKPWNPESPILYKAVFNIYYRNSLLHTVTKQFGFRTVQVKPRDGIYINGVRVKMKGVNRHSFRPETGRTLSKKQSIEDVLLMKEMNMNAVRMSHYPPDDHFLDVCDSLGLFVIDELAGWHGHYDTPTGTKLVEEMIRHDQHHPSIVIWANGNEGGHNFDLDSLFTRFDMQKRPVIHPWQLFGGIETQHYREYNYGIGNYEYGREILMPTEFLHGWFDGGHGAGLEDYWEKMWINPLSAGGFLWDFADQGIIRKDLNDSIDTDKHRGADGILGPHHEKEASYYAIKEIWSPVHFEEKQITPSFDGVMNFENRFHYTNINECTFSYQLKRFKRAPVLDKKGKIASVSLKPGEKGMIKIDLPNDWNTYDVLNVTVSNKSGEILTKSFPITRPAFFVESIIADAGEKPVLTTRDTLFQVATKGQMVIFHRKTGLLLMVMDNNSKVAPLTNGPIIQEGANNFGEFTARFNKDTLVISSAFDRKEHYNTLEWTVYPNGIIKMKVRYFPAAYFTSMAGVNFSYPEDQLSAVRYLGDGPYRVWKNRLKGNQFGVWKKEYNNTETGESPWKYPEFKGYYSNFYWGEFLNDRFSFGVATSNEGLFLRLFSPAWKTDQWHNYEPLFPSGDISFMQGIPSIGTKNQRNETTGPMGFKNIFYDYEKEPSRTLQIELYFDFITQKFLPR
jgi:hypothetical protein